mmetsp:Transcript_68689/g.143444  ORF Transcript_68689/g.143444 Transcript_68689/m.143444 type:complete len:251 (-) Transcript_68689:1202-1954(-)
MATSQLVCQIDLGTDLVEFPEFDEELRPEASLCELLRFSTHYCHKAVPVSVDDHVVEYATKKNGKVHLPASLPVADFSGLGLCDVGFVLTEVALRLVPTVSVVVHLHRQVEFTSVIRKALRAEEQAEEDTWIQSRLNALHSLQSPVVVPCSCGGVRQNLVSPGESLKCLLRLEVAWVLVWVALPCLLVVGRLDSRRGSIRCDSQELVIGGVHGWQLLWLGSASFFGWFALGCCGFLCFSLLCSNFLLELI